MDVEKAIVRSCGAVEVVSILRVQGFGAVDSKKMKF
jgi:hypothetical protein